MRIPDSPDAAPLTHLSPSQYEAGRVCNARLAWATAGRRSDLPDHPRALLGSCFHTVVEAAALGRLSEESDEALGAAARAMFDHVTHTAYGRAHELLRVKYASAEALPYYFLLRERAAVTAINVAERRGASRVATEPSRRSTPTRRLIETTLTSSDGLLSGRPDFIDLETHEIVDYKTGTSIDHSATLSPSEARQLKLYVHLALENGLSVSRGVILRPGGRRAITEVSEEQAGVEGRLAREVLQRFNETAGRPFEATAQPSRETCEFCPCIPFCEPFWRDATPEWTDSCGTHIEGRIIAITESEIQSAVVLTFDLEVSRGTLDVARAFIEQVPESWIRVGGSLRPEIGETLRVVHGREASPGVTPVIRLDRMLTSLWTIPSRNASTT